MAEEERPSDCIFLSKAFHWGCADAHASGSIGMLHEGGRGERIARSSEKESEVRQADGNASRLELHT